MRISDWSSDVCSSDLTVRWINVANVHTTTAYHPNNANHALRIPEGAAPWDSDYLVNPGDTFAVTLTVEGVYDYYCAPHEPAGMVGRIIVGRTAGPATLPPDVYRARSAGKGWEAPPPRSEERSGGKEGLSTVRFRGSPYHSKK